MLIPNNAPAVPHHDMLEVMASHIAATWPCWALFPGARFAQSPDMLDIASQVPASFVIEYA